MAAKLKLTLVLKISLFCDFRHLCMEPRSASDFIEIAKQFSTVLVNSVPALDDDLRDPTRRFIYLVDEFYDRRVKLLVTSRAVDFGLISRREVGV